VFLYAEPQSCLTYARGKDNDSYEMEECMLLDEANFTVAIHLAFAFLLFLTFGYKGEREKRVILLRAAHMGLRTPRRGHHMDEIRSFEV